MKFSKRMVIGNWKMNPLAVKDAEGLLVELTKHIKSSNALETTVMVAPPAPFLLAIQKKAEKAGVQLVAQTMSGESVGPFTGQISAKQLKSVGASAVIVGHSERRASGMTNAEVNTVVLQALKEKMTPIVCVGEVTRDSVGDFYSYIETQLKTALAGVVKSRLGEVVLAYEPVWAIGTGKTATPEDVLEIKLYIQKVLITLYDRSVVPKVRILYGGSVNAKNALELLEKAEVDGFLVGGASLQPKEFSSIIMTVEKYVRK
jgi:triosephosphate isomerase (TIM)